MKKHDHVDTETGLVEEGNLNQVIHVHTRRENGSLRIQTDYKFCPTMAEQHTAHLSDINYLMARFKPDELAAYISARGAQKTEIIGHDFSKEPDLQGAKNIVYGLKKAFDELSDDVKMHFKNHVEFLKFIDNPANAEKMLKLGLMTKREIKQNQSVSQSTNDNPNDDKPKQTPPKSQKSPQQEA